MKTKNILIPLVVATLLSGCTFNIGFSSSVTPLSGGSSSGSSSPSIPSSLDSNPSSTQSQGGAATYHFYAINDFHGSVLQRGSEGGLNAVFSYMKKQKDADPEHTFLLSSGDMWQGSLESNTNYGALITEAMNVAGFDSMTLGNHDFDYGKDRLLANKELANFPFLAGNIYTWENGAATSTRWSGSDNSVIIERGGHKIGIVGMIGNGQTTSITSKNVQDVTFKNPQLYAVNEAARLKKEGCDITVLSIHDSVSAVSSWTNLKKSYDAVFSAHTHRSELETQDGVPLVQGACNGEYVSHITLSIDENNNVSSLNYENIEASTTWEIDPAISAVTAKYIETDEFKATANRTVGTLSRTINSTEVAQLGVVSIYDKYKDSYSDLVCAMENGQRASIYRGSFTYSDLYKATPFTNNIVIAKVKGSDIKAEAKYNVTYTGNTTKYATLSDSSFYTIACIDYILYHQNVNKTYDYFPSLNEGMGGEVIAEYETYPMDLTYDYCKKIGPSIDVSKFADGASGINLYK